MRLTKTVIFVMLLAFGTAGNLQSASIHFGLSQPELAAFPEVRASFSAMQANGNYFEDITPSNFTIIENDEEIPLSKIRVECEDQVPADILLVLDNSTSMSEVIDGKKKWDWVSESVKNFLAGIHLPEGSTIGILIFNSKPTLVQDFTEDTELLSQAMQGLNPVQAPTDFNNCFLTPESGVVDMLSKRAYDRKRIAIMLSDGNHTEERGALKLEEITRKLSINNIVCHTITYLEPEGSEDLMVIAEKTGGNNEHVTSPNQLDDIYSMISDNLFKIPLCFLIWESTISCDPVESFRNLEVSFDKIPAQKVKYSYKAPDWSVYDIETSEDIYDFGNPEVGTPVTVDVVLTPSLDAKISDIIMMPDDLFTIVDYGQGLTQMPGNGISIAAGESRTFKVQFIQQESKQPRFAVLYMDAEPCALEIPLVAGQEQIEITKPVETDAFSACDKVEINWRGIDETKRVTLYYSLNGGAWKEITKSAAGGKHTWTPPVTEGSYRVRGLVTYKKEYQWLIGDGGAADETIKTIAAQENELFFAVCGLYSAPTEISGKKLKHGGGTDWFLAKYDMNGTNRWVVSGIGAGNETVEGCVMDAVGNTYITGTAYDGMIVENSSSSLIRKDTRYTYIAKFSPHGELVKIDFIQPTNPTLVFESWSSEIKLDFDGTAEPTIVVRGRYLGQYSNSQTGQNLPEAKWPKNYTAYFNSKIQLTGIIGQHEPPNDGFAGKKVTFPSQTEYETGNFSNSKSVGGFTVESNGGTDFWVSKQAMPAQNQDISETFELKVPQQELVYNNFIKDSLRYFTSDSSRIFCDSVFIGKQEVITLDKVLTSNSDFPVTVVSYTVSGPNPNAFEIPASENGKVINPGDTVDLNIVFRPSDEAQLEAFVTLNPDCGDPVMLRLIGQGLCGAETADVIDFGGIPVESTEKEIFTTTFFNPMTISIDIKPVINSDNEYSGHWRDFEIISMMSGGQTLPLNRQIEIAPFQSIDFEIEFTPSTLGDRVAYIDYNAPFSCSVENTPVIGKGLSGKLTVNNIDWGNERFAYDFPTQTIEINNLGNTAKTIERYELEDPALNNVFRVDYPQTPFDIEGNVPFEIDVDFVPESDIDYETKLHFYSTELDTATVVLRGSAYLPKMETEVFCAPDINVGDTGEAYIEISNPSTSSDLTVFAGTIENPDEFQWKNGTETLQTQIIPSGETERFLMDYNPAPDGNHSTVIKIEADDFDAEYGSERKITDVSLTCDALKIDTDPVASRTGLLCEDMEFGITVRNNSQATTAYIYPEQALIEGQGSEFFSVSTDEIQIDGGNSATVPVYFNSDIEGVYTVEITIPTSGGEPIVSEITAECTAIEPTVNPDEVSLLPGEKQKVDFNLDIPATDKGTVEDLNLKIKQSGNGIFLDIESLKSEITSMTWSTPEQISEYEITLSGTGSLDLPFSGTIFSMDYVSMLEGTGDTQINLEIDYDCTVRDFDVHLSKKSEYCASDFRDISAELLEGPGTIAPNPVSDRIKIDFWVSDDNTPVRIDLYDIEGRKIGTLYSSILQTGTYEMTFSTENVDSGAYILKYKAGNFVKDIRIAVVN